MTEERWLPVVGYEGLYEVSDLGRVKSMERRVRSPSGTRRVRERILRTKADTRGGYLHVPLSHDWIKKNWPVHKLVLTAFVGPCPLGKEARHFPDNNPTNNKLENLSWSTTDQNGKDKITHGTSPRGEKNVRHKLTEEQVRFIRASNWSNRYLSDHLSVSMCTVWQIRVGDTWSWLK
jgi:hypothetical protein